MPDSRSQNVSLLKYLNIFFKISVLLVLLEISFRVLIPASEVPYSYYDSTHGILRFDTGERCDGLYTNGSRAEIRAGWHVNNMGWLSAHDYNRNHDKPVIAIIGDSYVEALHVGTDRSFSNHLQEKLSSSYDVYSFGLSGVNLSQYLQMSRYVRSMFQPKLLIINMVENDIPDSLLPHHNKPGTLFFSFSRTGQIEEKLLPAHADKNKYIYRKSAFLRYLRLNNGFLGKKSAENDAVTRPLENTALQEDMKNYHAILKYTFAKLRIENPNTAVLIVLDAPRRDIYQGRSNKKYMETAKVVSEVSGEFGFQVLDLTAPMSESFRRDKKKFNFEKNWHWNEYGHKFVADQVFKKLVSTSTITPGLREQN